MEYQANRGSDMHRRNELRGRYSGVGQFVKVYDLDGKSVRVNDGYYGDLGNGKKETISAQDVALYNANVSSGKYNGIESYRAWQKNPNYNPGEDKYDRMFRLMGNAHLEEMMDFGGGGYNMFGGYGRALSSGVWELNALERGLEIEGRLGGNLPKNFPVIDRFANGAAESIKSIDVTTKTGRNLSAFRSTLKGYVNKVANFEGGQLSGVRVKPTDITRRVLTVAVQDGKVTSPQQKVLNSIVKYGTGVDFEVIIKYIR